MQIRLATKLDQPALLSLWQEAFGDTKETIETFFKLCFSPQRTIVAAENGEAVAALYLLDATLKTPKESFSLSYVYAAATKQSYQKKGIMTKLLSYAKDLAAREKKDALYLVPASESLFTYYQKRGYQNAFLKEIYTIEAENLFGGASSFTLAPLQDAAIYAQKRDALLKSYSHLQFPKESLQLDLYFAKTFETPILENAFGLCKLDTEEKTLTLSEFLFPTEKQMEILYALSKKNSAKYIKLHLPFGANCNVPAQKEQRYAGMILPLQKNLTKEYFATAYLGVTLG